MSKFSNACGMVARLHGPLNVDEWKDVNPHIKRLMWDELQNYLVYPPGLEGNGKKYALSTMAHRWRQWKSDINTYYVQQNKPPFEKYGNISIAEWDTFVAKMTTLEALARRKKMSDLAKRNKYNIHTDCGQVDRMVTWTNGELRRKSLQLKANRCWSSP
jgi:hypothetical protein